jgi:hypothetical protein
MANERKVHKILFGKSQGRRKSINEYEYSMGRNKMHTGFWRRNPQQRDNLKHLSVDGRKILKSVLNK